MVPPRTVLNGIAETGLRVEGHTDSDGDPASNQVLSERRAQAVVDYLVAHQVRTSLYYAAFPNTTVAEIKAALNVQRELIAFIQSHQTADNVALLQLRTAYLQESELWESSS